MSEPKFMSEAAPMFMPEIATDIDKVHPFVRGICREFKACYDQLKKAKRAREKDMDEKCRLFFQGAYATRYTIEGDGANAYQRDGSLNPATDLGALALFIGGDMARNGPMRTVRGVWELMGIAE